MDCARDFGPFDGKTWINCSHQGSPETSDIPVVVITGKSLTDEERERLKGWMVNTIEKRSIPEEQLLGRVRELVRDQTQIES